MNLKLRIKKMKKIIYNSTLYKVMFECDRELIPDKSERSLIKNCSINMFDSSQNKRRSRRSSKEAYVKKTNGK